MHERDGTPATGIVACLLLDGARAWGALEGVEVLAAAEREELCGRPARLHTGGRLEPD
jgi:hypothetical protein